MSAEDFKTYMDAMNNASLLAQRDLDEIWSKLDKSDPYATRDALIALVPGLVYKYGNMAALASANYYEAERLQAGGDESFRAELAEAAPIEQIEASVRFACGHLFKEVDDGV